MVRKLCGMIQIYYFFALLLILCSLGGSFYFYKESRLIDTNYIASIHESLAIVEELKNSREIRSIKTIVENDRVKETIKKIDLVRKKVKRVNDIKRMDSSSDLNKTLNDLEESVVHLLSFPKLSALFKVFEAKLTKFNNFAVSNKWKTLSRVSSRLRSEIYQGKNFSYNKLKKISENLKKRLNIMVNVTRTSTLTDAEKKRTHTFFDSLNVETVMLQKYLLANKIFLENYANYSKAFNYWANEYVPILTREKIEIRSKNNYFVIASLGIFASVVLFMLFGIMVYMLGMKGRSRRLENNILEIIKDGVMAKEPNLKFRFTDQFLYDLGKCHYYIQKRMSLSSIFQSSLPFPAVLLNSNLKVIWTNPLFCECFKIKNFEFEKESLSWDYLVRFTNLNGSDPVLESLKNNLASIYQIKIRKDQNSEMQPYEMYVSPVNDLSQKRLMLFFYPLSSMEETISEQGLTLINPIIKTLEAMSKNKYNQEFYEFVKKDFQAANIEDILLKFNGLYKITRIQLSSLSNEIDRLENNLEGNYSLLEKIDENNSINIKKQGDIYKNFNKMKDEVLSHIKVNKDYLEKMNLMMSLSKNMSDFVEVILGTLKDYYEKIDGTHKVIDVLLKEKRILKTVKDSVKTLIPKLNQSLDKLLIFEKVEVVEVEKLSRSLKKVKVDTGKINSEMQKLDKIMSVLDIQLSKAEMVLAKDLNNEDMIGTSKQKLHEFNNLIKERSYEKNKLDKISKEQEEKIEKSLNRLQIDCKDILDLSNNDNKLVKNNIENSMQQ